jgi:hypothetical protein
LDPSANFPAFAATRACHSTKDSSLHHRSSGLIRALPEGPALAFPISSIAPSSNCSRALVNGSSDHLISALSMTLSRDAADSSERHSIAHVALSVIPPSSRDSIDSRHSIAHAALSVIPAL